MREWIWNKKIIIPLYTILLSHYMWEPGVLPVCILIWLPSFWPANLILQRMFNSPTQHLELLFRHEILFVLGCISKCSLSVLDVAVNHHHVNNKRRKMRILFNRMDSEDTGLYNVWQLMSSAWLGEAHNSLCGTMVVFPNDRYSLWVTEMLSWTSLLKCHSSSLSQKRWTIMPLCHKLICWIIFWIIVHSFWRTQGFLREKPLFSFKHHTQYIHICI